MATRAITPTKHHWGSYSFAWAGLLDGDDGAPIDPDKGSFALSDKTIQFTGTIGAGFSGVAEGSNDGVKWSVLTVDGSTAISITTDGGMAAIYENPLYVRPQIAGGDGTTLMGCTISARGQLLRR